MKTEFGSGVISPKLGAHLATATPSKPKTSTTTEFGSGVIYPKLSKHLRG